MKKGLTITLTILASVLLTVGIVRAATEHNVTSTLGGVSGDLFNVDGTMIVDSLKVGDQTSGGVTFFNGTIINNTTTNGSDNPVTFGDNVRIDGRVYRGATAGTSDSMPFIVNDNMEVVGTLTASGSPVAKRTVYAGTIDLTQDGDEIVNVDIDGVCGEGLVTQEDVDYHYKIVSIPDIELSDMPDVHIYLKSHSDVNTDSAPNSGDIWTLGTDRYSEGKAYVLYKAVYNRCDPPNFISNYVTDYKIVVVK